MSNSKSINDLIKRAQKTNHIGINDDNIRGKMKTNIQKALFLLEDKLKYEKSSCIFK